MVDHGVEKPPARDSQLCMSFLGNHIIRVQIYSFLPDSYVEWRAGRLVPVKPDLLSRIFCYSLPQLKIGSSKSLQ